MEVLEHGFLLSGSFPHKGFVSVTVIAFNLYEIPRHGVSLVKAWEIDLVYNLVLAWKFRKIESPGF